MKSTKSSSNDTNNQKKISSYPFTRAVQFRNETKNTSLLFSNDSSAEDLNSTFLDQTKCMITEIGNLIGFAKLFCSAANHFRNDVLHSCFPNKDGQYGIDLDKDGDGIDHDTATSLDQIHGSDEINRAVDHLNELLRMISDHPNNKRNATHFKQFIGTFYEANQEIITSMQESLKNAYILIPTLSLSWIEANIQAKEMIYKKNRTLDAFFSNDGVRLFKFFHFD